MSDTIEVKCKCGGPLYVRGEPRGHDKDGNPLYVWWECPCDKTACQLAPNDANSEWRRREEQSASVIESIRKANGNLLTLGFNVPWGTHCPCCHEPVRHDRNPWRNAGKVCGIFLHEGKSTWVCKACWGKHTPKGDDQ